MTPILKIITEYCEQYVDDIRYEQLKIENPPLYARRMWNLFKPSIAFFDKPDGIQEYLLGEDDEKLVPPLYDTTIYTVEQDYAEDFTISLEAGYELFSCHERIIDDFNNVDLKKVNAEYDEATGIVTVHATEENPINKGTMLDFDFYTDGYFCECLSNRVLSILGQCFEIKWQGRFNSDWLDIVPKVEDKSFKEQNRANKMTADTERIRELKISLADSKRAFGQTQAWKKIKSNII